MTVNLNDTRHTDIECRFLDVALSVVKLNAILLVVWLSWRSISSLLMYDRIHCIIQRKISFLCLYGLTHNKQSRDNPCNHA
jgi:hypothetical protein